MTTTQKRHVVRELKLAEISSVDRPAQTGAVSVLMKSASGADPTYTAILKSASAVARGEPVTFTRLDYENALLKRADELAAAQGITPELALFKNLTTDGSIRELTNAYEAANAAEYGMNMRKRYAGADA